MTPEQETYKEYGRAQEALHQTIKEIKKESFFTFGKPYCKLTKLERESISHALGLCGKVRYVRHAVRMPDMGIHAHEQTLL